MTHSLFALGLVLAGIAATVVGAVAVIGPVALLISGPALIAVGLFVPWERLTDDADSAPAERT